MQDLFKTMMMAIQNLKSSFGGESAQGLVEYAMVLAFISTALIVALMGVESPLSQLYDTIHAAFP